MDETFPNFYFCSFWPPELVVTTAQSLWGQQDSD